MRRHIVAKPRMVIGTNVISNGNDYGEDDSVTLAALAPLHRISIRVIWAVAETTRGTYDSGLMTNLGRVMDWAASANIPVLLDFHTLWDDGSYTMPSWVGNASRIATDSGIQQAFVDLQTHYISGLLSKSAFDAISVVNEPWGVSNSLIESLINRLIANAHTVAPTRKVGERYATDVNPTAPNPLQMPVGADFLGINTYDDPALYPNGGGWPGKIAAGKLSIPYWITEFGLSTTDDTAQANYYTQYLQIAKDINASCVLAWVWQYTTTTDNHNIHNRPAFTVLVNG